MRGCKGECGVFIPLFHSCSSTRTSTFSPSHPLPSVLSLAALPLVKLFLFCKLILTKVSSLSFPTTLTKFSLKQKTLGNFFLNLQFTFLMVEYAKMRRRPSNYKILARQNEMEEDLLEDQRCYGEFKFW